MTPPRRLPHPPWYTPRGGEGVSDINVTEVQSEQVERDNPKALIRHTVAPSAHDQQQRRRRDTSLCNNIIFVRAADDDAWHADAQRRRPRH